MGMKYSSMAMCAITIGVAVVNYILNDPSLDRILNLLTTIMVVMIYYATYREK